MLRPSKELAPYLDYDNGKLIISKDLPKDLEKEAEEYKKVYKDAHKKDTIIEY